MGCTAMSRQSQLSIDAGVSTAEAVVVVVVVVVFVVLLELELEMGALVVLAEWVVEIAEDVSVVVEPVIPPSVGAG